VRVVSGTRHGVEYLGARNFRLMRSALPTFCWVFEDGQILIKRSVGAKGIEGSLWRIAEGRETCKKRVFK